MRNSNSNKNEEMRKHLREFVNSIMNKDYAAANANLILSVKEKIKEKVTQTLEEN